MTLSTDYIEALQELADSNLLNGERAITYFLQASAEESELVAFLERNAPDVSLQDELAALSETGDFPAAPEISLPFIYTLLYLFDKKNGALDEVLTRLYKGTETDVAYAKFFVLLTDAIKRAIDIPVSETGKTVIENDDSDETDVFDAFIGNVKKIVNPFDAAALEESALDVKKHVEKRDLEKAIVSFLDLKKRATDTGLAVEHLEGIRKYLLALGGKK